jgi:hypothetical protein
LFCNIREEHRLKAYENRELRRILVSKRSDMTGSWRKLHNEGLYNLYYSPDIIRMMNPRKDEMGRSCSTLWVKRNACRILVEKQEDDEEDLDIGGWTILKYILARMGWYGLDRSGSG